MATAHFPLFSVEITRGEIPVETMSPSRVPDEKWRYIDKKGHLHAWVDGEVPTLDWVVIGKTWVGDEYDGEEIEVGEHRCRVCAEPIEPMLKVKYGPSSVPGPTTVGVTIHGETFPLSEMEYAASVNDWLDAIRAIVERRRS
jgi:hypothetical protein